MGTKVALEHGSSAVMLFNSFESSQEEIADGIVGKGQEELKLLAKLSHTGSSVLEYVGIAVIDGVVVGHGDPPRETTQMPVWAATKAAKVNRTI